MADRQPFYQQVANRIIEQLKEGTAPWIRPWEPGEQHLPYNPVSGTRYKGANSIWLASAGYADPRWMTYKQAQSKGWQVRRGEHGQLVQYWKFYELMPKMDENGRPVLDESGKPLGEMIRLERPRVFHAVVFNAQQIDGVPPLERREYDWNPVERAEEILAKSGATIIHDQKIAGAAYSPSRDMIYMPAREQFRDAPCYYATALHELGHWTGHPSRLDRDLAHPFGSEGYAKEELRAEIASLMLGDELGIGHDPGQHVAYVDSWIKVLQDDPREIVLASRDAERIMGYLIDIEMARTRDPGQEIPTDLGKTVASSREVVMNSASDERTYLAVPYEEKDQAKALGARWDRKNKAWYAPKGVDLEPLRRWLPQERDRQASDPRMEFAEAIRAAGLILEGLPVMDGKWHRLPVEGGKRGALDGSYRGFLDGRPAGYIENFKAGIKQNWVSSSVTLTPEERARMEREAAERRAKRDAEQERKYREVADRVEQTLAQLKPCTGQEPYLVKKGVSYAIPGVLADNEGTIYIPAKDKERVWSVQRIQGNGFRGFEKDSRKRGTYFVIDEGNQDKAHGVMICEGLATGASIHQATGVPVVVAFDAGNLKHVAQEFRERYPNKPIVIMGDDDRHQKVNRGREAAEEAAKAVKGFTMFPYFKEHWTGKEFKDWNDLHRAAGSMIVESQIKSGMRAIMRKHLKLLHQEHTIQQDVVRQKGISR